MVVTLLMRSIAFALAVTFTFLVPAHAGLLDDIRNERAHRPEIADRIATADSARVHGETEAATSGELIRDAAWIKTVSAALSQATLGTPGCCLCAGWKTAYFYRNGKLIASVAAIHGNQLRIFWPGGGGDFPVDAASWALVKAALEPPSATGHETAEPRASSGSHGSI